MAITLDTKLSMSLARWGGAVAAVVWFSVRAERLASGIEREVTRIRVDLEGKYTLAAASEQALRMAIENPGLRIPDPRDPQQVIVVDRARFSSSSFLPLIVDPREALTRDTMPGS